ncbi:MAG: tetratricopeptide repeat protein [Bacteroidota bacterium]|nr:tetratricopeptide repeat protein [Bacteroidota bacterium]
MNRVILAIIVAVLFIAAQGAQSQDTRESAEFKLAVQLFDDGFFAQAEDQFRAFIDRFPNSASAVEARFYLGALQRKSKKYREARQTFQDFALRHQDHPRAADAWWNLGEIYALEHNYAEAAQAFAKLKSFHPKSARAAEALLQAGQYFLRVDDTENARTVLNSILLEYPKSSVRTEAQMQLGRLYIAQGEYERALREFTRMLSEAIPAATRPEVIVAIGETQAALGHRTEAEARYREVIGTYPASAASHLARVKLGDLQREFRDFAAARESYTAVSENTDAAVLLRQHAYAGLAQTASAEGDDGAAVQAWERLFAAAGETGIAPETTREAAAAARRAGEYGKAARWLEALYADTLVMTDRRSLLVDMAETAREGKNFASALTHYRSYLQRYPDDAGAASALLRIAEIEEIELQNYSRAQEHYAGVIERYGMTRVSDDAQYGRARTLEKQARSVEAAEAYRQVLLQYPASRFSGEARMAYDRLTELGGGNAQESVLQLAGVIAAMHENPGSASVDLLLANVYLEQVGDFKRAERFFNAALSKGVSGEDAEEARYGAALAGLRMVQAGERSLAEAKGHCGEFFAAYPAGDRHDRLAWTLFRLESANADATDQLAAASAFLARNPASHRAAALVVSGMAQLALGRSAEAAQDFDAVISTAAETQEGADAWYGRARTHASARRFEQALSDLASYITRAPNGRYAADARLLQGRLLARVGRYDESLAIYDDIATRFAYADAADSARIALLAVLTENGRHRDALQRATRYLAEVDDNPFCSPGARQEYLFAQAVALASARERSEAKRALLRYAQDYPGGAHSGEVYYALGQMYRDEGKVDLASSYLQQAATLKQGTAALRDAADLLLENGKYMRAIDAYTRLSERSDIPAERQYAQSRIVIAQLRDGQIADAERNITAFRAAWPEAEGATDEFMLERGKHHHRMGEYRAAQDLFDDVEDSDIRALAALGRYWNGRCLEAQSRNADARELFEDVIEDYAGTEAALESRMSLARMSMRAEKYQDAAAQYRAVVDAGDIPEPMRKEALNGLISAYDVMGMYDVAAEMTRRFLEAWPGDPTAFRKRVNLGIFLTQLRYFDTAIDHLESILAEATPDDQAEIRYYIGEAYFYKHDFTQAALEFLKVPYLVVGKTEIDWASAAYAQAGECYRELSKFDQAIDMYQKVVDTPGVDPRFRAEAEKRIKEIRALMN